MLAHNLISVVIAFFGGILPSIVWLVFWNKEKKKPEPKSMIALAFVGGIAAVFISLLLEKIAFGLNLDILFSGHILAPILAWFKHISASENIPLNQLVLVILFAPIIEEILKFSIAYVLVLRTKDNDEPIDPMIYMISTALGFAAIENMLFLIDPITHNNFVTSILTGDTRFVGAMLLHTVASATVGMFISFNFFDKKIEKIFWTIVGIIAAICIHSAFNFFMAPSGSHIVVLEIIWIIVIIVLLAFEKIKRVKLEKI